MNRHNIIGGTPLDMPSPRGWKSREANAKAKIAERSDPAQIEARRLRQFIHDLDRVKAEVTAVRGRVEGLRGNRATLETKMATLNAWALQNGKVHQDAMKITFGISSAGPIIAKAERDLAEAVDRLADAQRRHDAAMAEADQRDASPATEPAEPVEVRRGPGRPKKDAQR